MIRKCKFWILLGLLLLSFASISSANEASEVDEESEKTVYQYKFSCNVYLDDGAKAVISGNYEYKPKDKTNAKVPFLFDVKPSKRLPSFKGHAILSDNRDMFVEKIVNGKDLYDGIEYDYQFSGPRGDFFRGFVVIHATTCLRCVALRVRLIGTGICNHIYEE